MSRIRRVTITPEEAERVLRANRSNRRLDKTVWTRYGEDMARGDWADNGEVSVQMTGTWEDPQDVHNGQHTLTAVAMSGVTIDLWVAEDVAAYTVLTMDSGKMRTFAHDLQREGIKDATNVAAAVRLSYLWAKRDPRSRVKITRHELYPYWDEHRDIVESSRRAGRLIRHIKVARSVIAAFHYRAKDIDPEQTEEFLVGVQEGADLSRTSPILWCRKRLIHFTAHDSFPEQDVVLGYVVTAWNLWRQDYAVESLTYKHSKGPFPEPQ